MSHTKINISTTNCSLQVGDNAYASEILSGGITSEPKLIGEIVDVKVNYIIVKKDISAVDLLFPAGVSGMFLMFAKRIEANDSSLKGYYADVTFENHSNQYVELFAVGSETSFSSK